MEREFGVNVAGRLPAYVRSAGARGRRMAQPASGNTSAGLERFRRTAADRLAAFRPTGVPLDGRQPAAVAVVLAGDPAGAPAFVLTRRAATLRAHAGQWALPGGRVDPGESTPDAARRECAEEVGLDLPASALLGRLDDYGTRSGYVISPVVLWAGPAPRLVAAEAEVAEIYVVPLAEIDRPPRLISIPESPAPVIQLPMYDRVIHAPTAAVLHQLAEVVLHGRHTPVSHFEQPVFAWR
jgi:8-oxo-dGTP pyrophosphatase MutT (NUDIX family)